MRNTTKSKKWLAGVASIALLVQVGQPVIGYATETSHNEVKVFLHQETASIPTKEQSQWNYQAIKGQLAYESGYTGKGVKIALIDTGVSPHKDLKIAGGVSTIDGETSYLDTNGHGTHVAGILNAQPNGFGLVGVAPNAELYAVKAVTGDDNGKLSDIVEGIEWAIQNEMDIINLSVGIQTDEPQLKAVIQKAYKQGVIIVASSGNNGSNSSVSYPAKYPEVISVSAVDRLMNQATFSSKGESVDFTAPGVDIASTFLDDQYALISGTSQATPHVVGLLALLKEKYPTKTSRELENELQLYAEDLGVTGKDDVFGYGFLSYDDSIETGKSISTPTTFIVTDLTSEPVAKETFTAQQQTYITYAERYIGYVEQYKRTSYASTAQIYINKLPDGQKKTELNLRLQQAVASITGSTAPATGTSTTTTVSSPTTTTPMTTTETQPTTTTSQTSPTQTVETVETAETFTSLQKSYITYAERYIAYTLQYKKMTYANTAQIYINKLPDGKTKTELNQKLQEAIATISAS